MKFQWHDHHHIWPAKSEKDRNWTTLQATFHITWRLSISWETARSAEWKSPAKDTTGASTFRCTLVRISALEILFQVANNFVWTLFQVKRGLYALAAVPKWMAYNNTTHSAHINQPTFTQCVQTKMVSLLSCAMTAITCK